MPSGPASCASRPPTLTPAATLTSPTQGCRKINYCFAREEAGGGDWVKNSLFILEFPGNNVNVGLIKLDCIFVLPTLCILWNFSMNYLLIYLTSINMFTKGFVVIVKLLRNI